jgi:hypothetical protein
MKGEMVISLRMKVYFLGLLVTAIVVALIMDNGGKDNITVVIAKIH